LTAYYEDCVTGGPDAFVLSVRTPSLLAETISRKMVQEISQRGPRLEKANTTRVTPRVDCEMDHHVPNMITTPAYAARAHQTRRSRPPEHPSTTVLRPGKNRAACPLGVAS